MEAAYNIGDIFAPGDALRLLDDVAYSRMRAAGDYHKPVRSVIDKRRVVGALVGAPSAAFVLNFAQSSARRDARLNFA